MKKQRVEWKTFFTHAAMFERWNRRCLVIVQAFPHLRFGEVWQVVAVESNASADTEDAVFADHAHKAIGRFKTEQSAKRAAIRFGREWMMSRDRAKACMCEEIRK